MNNKTVILSICIVFSLLCGCEKNLSISDTAESASGQPALTTPEKVYIFDNHRDSYKAWRENEVKQATVVHIDTHLDFNWMSNDDLTMLSEETPYGSKLNQVMTRDNYLYAATRNDLVKKIYWVVPDKELPPEPVFLDWLRDSFNQHQLNLSLDEVNSFRRQGRVFAGRLYDTDVIICTLATLPVIKEEALLDLDLDYFFFDSFYFTASREAFSTELWSFLDRLKRKKLKISLVTIAASVSGGYTPINHRIWGAVIRESLISGEPPNADLFKLQNRALDDYQNRDYQQAREKTEQALELDDVNGVNYYLLSQIERAAGNAAAADEAYQESRKRDTFYLQANLYEARFLANRGKLEEARKLYEIFLQEKPDDPAAFVELGSLLMNMELREEAEKYVRLAWQIDKNYWAAHALVGDFLNGRREINQVIPFTAYQRAEQFSPDYISFGGALGYFYAERHQLAKAEEAFIEASKLGPVYDLAYLNLASFYLNGEQTDKAVVALDNALRYNPRNVQACYNLSQLYLEAGKRKQAKKLLEKTLKLLPDDELLQSAYAELNQSRKK